MPRNPKFTQENLKTVLRVLTDLERVEWRHARDAKLKREQFASAKVATAHRRAIDMIEYSTGIKYEPYGDERELAIYEAEQDGVVLNL